MFLGTGNEICYFNFSIEYFLMNAISCHETEVARFGRVSGRIPTELSEQTLHM
jgi:hypothetical protein